MKRKFSIVRITNFLAIILIALTFGFETRLSAQSFDISNASDASHPWSSDINPAVVSFQYAQASLGLKIFHYGFLPDQNLGIQQTHINGSFPFYLPYGLAIGGDLRYFSAGIYSEFNSAIMVSRKILDRLAIGVKLGLGRYGFAKQDFKLVDANDPLLLGNLGKTILNFGIGAYWNPGKWCVGLALDHLNQPDIGRKTNANLPQELSAAVAYDLGKIMPALLIQNDGTWIRFGVAISAKYQQFGLIRLSYESTMPFKIEAQFNLSRDNSLQYGFDLPQQDMSTVSMGSHELIFSHIFDRGPEIEQPKILMSADTLKIYEETIVRYMDKEIAPNEIIGIPELVPEYLEATGKYRDLLIIPTGHLSPYETAQIRLKRYDRFAKEIQWRVKQNPAMQLILHANESTLADARGMKQYLSQKGISNPDEIGLAKRMTSGKTRLEGFEPGFQQVTRNNPVCSTEKLGITFVVPGKTRQVKEWEMSIMNSQNEVVKTFKGTDKLPDLLDWDWKNNWGEFVSPGKYICSLNILGMSGLKKTANSEPIKVVRLNRIISLRFSQEHPLHATKMVPK
ncbi:type IX secretion system membrane protein PorP/SprF [candidate division KSB1 bacterium]|nr:type IX secretion system membrane protein PorP/SprF [candidate division KSB1 bacterium]